MVKMLWMNVQNVTHCCNVLIINEVSAALQNLLFWLAKVIVLGGKTYCFSVRNNRFWKTALTVVVFIGCIS